MVDDLKLLKTRARKEHHRAEEKRQQDACSAVIKSACENPVWFAAISEPLP
jgi:hypothetical protein